MRDEVLAKVRQTRQLAPGRPEREGTTPALLRWRRRTAIAVAAGILVAGAGTATWAVQQQEVLRQRSVNESVQVRARAAARTAKTTRGASSPGTPPATGTSAR